MADAINELKSKGIYRFENKFDVDLADGTVLLFAKDKRTILTNMESALLYALIKAYEEEETHILTHTAACDFMGWSIKVESQAPEAERQFLRDLQKKIDPEKELIKSVSGKGYRLTMTPSRIADSIPPDMVSRSDSYYEITQSDEYRSFVSRLLSKYYGDAFLTNMNGTMFPVYTIPGVQLNASKYITDMDSVLCPKDRLTADFGEDGTFDASKHTSYTECRYYDAYRLIVSQKMHYPNRPGYMMDSIALNADGKVDHISAHVGTYAENIFSSHSAEYELYLAYMKYKDCNIDDDSQWQKIYASLITRNEIHGGIRQCKGSDFNEKMKLSLLSGKNRHSLIGLEMLVLVRNPITRKYRVLLGLRSDKVAMLHNIYEFPPAGGFEILSESNDMIYDEDEILSDYSPGCAIFREYLEELFNMPEYDGSGMGSILDTILPDPRIQTIQKMLQSGKAVFQFLGVSIDLLLLRHNLNFALVIDDDNYPDGGFKVNDEYKKGRLLTNVSLDNIDGLENMWSRHHGASAGLWYLFKQTDLYQKTVAADL